MRIRKDERYSILAEEICVDSCGGTGLDETLSAKHEEAQQPPAVKKTQRK